MGKEYEEHDTFGLRKEKTVVILEHRVMGFASFCVRV